MLQHLTDTKNKS